MGLRRFKLQAYKRLFAANDPAHTVNNLLYIVFSRRKRATQRAHTNDNGDSGESKEGRIEAKELKCYPGSQVGPLPVPCLDAKRRGLINDTLSQIPLNNQEGHK